MKRKETKNIYFLILVTLILFLLMSGFVLAQENEENALEDQLGEEQAQALDSEIVSEEESQLSPSEIQSKLELLNTTAPVSLRLYNSEVPTSGSEVKVKARTGFLNQDTSTLNFKWLLKKDGVEQEIPLSRQGMGKSLFVFIPASSGNYEVAVEVTDLKNNRRVSQPLTVPIGKNILVTFEPLRPVSGQNIKVSATGFSQESFYQWVLDGEEQESTKQNFEFITTKSAGQAHKIKIAITDKNGVVSRKEIEIPVYRPEVIAQPVIDGVTVAGQAGTNREFFVKGNSPVTLYAEIPNFNDQDNVRYAWSINGQVIEEGVNKTSIVINPEDEKFKNLESQYTVNVLAVSSDIKNLASSEININKIASSSSLAAVNPEKIPNQHLVAESKSVFNSFGAVRKFILPVMIIVFAAVIVLGNTQPEKVE